MKIDLNQTEYLFNVIPCKWSLHIEGPAHIKLQLLGGSASCRKLKYSIFGDHINHVWIWHDFILYMVDIVVWPIELWIFKLSLSDSANMETWLGVCLQIIYKCNLCIQSCCQRGMLFWTVHYLFCPDVKREKEQQQKWHRPLSDFPKIR